MLCMCCLITSPQQPCKLGIIFSYILQIIICPIMIAKALSLKGHMDRWYKGKYMCNTVSLLSQEIWGGGKKSFYVNSI